MKGIINFFLQKNNWKTTLHFLLEKLIEKLVLLKYFSAKLSEKNGFLVFLKYSSAESCKCFF